MKTKYAIFIFVFGLCIDIIAALFKILHYSNADTLLITGTFLKVTGLLLFLYKLLTYPKFKDFLNW